MHYLDKCIPFLTDQSQTVPDQLTKEQTLSRNLLIQWTMTEVGIHGLNEILITDTSEYQNCAES